MRTELLAALAAEFPEREREIKEFFEDAHYDAVRGLIVEQRKRIDGRGLTDVRPITSRSACCRARTAPALFTRGETQALVVATLGTSSDEQKIDALGGEVYKKFMLHYNFPPYSVGEVKFLRGPGRRGDRPRGARRTCASRP